MLALIYVECQQVGYDISVNVDQTQVPNFVMRVDLRRFWTFISFFLLKRASRTITDKRRGPRGFRLGGPLLLSRQKKDRDSNGCGKGDDPKGPLRQGKARGQEGSGVRVRSERTPRLQLL